MINYTTADTLSDLEGILSLQKKNLPENLDKEEIKSQGFVTVHHSFEVLKKLNNIEKHVVAKDNNKVIGYTLAMTPKSKEDIPILVPMFNVFEKIDFLGKKISDYQFLVMGQVCVAKEYRGKGVFGGCYNAFREHYRNKYNFTITEIASTNTRSLHAHKKIGFETIYKYFAPDGTKWNVVVWNWERSNN